VNLIIRPDVRDRALAALHHATFLLAEGWLQRAGATVSVLAQGVKTLQA